MSDKNSNDIGDLFKMFVQENKLKPKLYEAKLKSSWVEVMGKLIDNYTSDISLKKRVLYIRLTSAPLRNELLMSKTKLIDLLNKKLGEEFIQDIVIR